MSDKGYSCNEWYSTRDPRALWSAYLSKQSQSDMLVSRVINFCDVAAKKYEPALASILFLSS
jgi:hypothetical protein